LGFSFQDRQVEMISGSHTAGMTLKINGQIMHRGTYKFATKSGDVVVTYRSHQQAQISSPQFSFLIYNSDMFFNIETGLNDRRLLRLGSSRHAITDSHLCAKEDHVDESKVQHQQHSDDVVEHNHGAVEAALQKKYGGAQVPLHGLIGQTWRNAVVCGKNWVGSVPDYVASDLFASDYFFNFFNSQ